MPWTIEQLLIKITSNESNSYIEENIDESCDFSYHESEYVNVWDIWNDYENTDEYTSDDNYYGSDEEGDEEGDEDDEDDYV